MGDRVELTGVLARWKCSNPNCPMMGGAVEEHDIIYCRMDMPSPQHCEGWDMFFIGGTGPVYRSATDNGIRDQTGMERALDALRTSVKPFRKGEPT